MRKASTLSRVAPSVKMNQQGIHLDRVESAEMKAFREKMFYKAILEETLVLGERGNDV